MVTLAASALGAVMLAAPIITAAGGVSFIDIASDDTSGITYHRVESPSDDILDTFKQGVLSLEQVIFMPANSRGAPGVAVFDYDGDGDQDIYVTNGPGAANSLYSNQHAQSGQVSFIDVATEVGAGLAGDDSTGVCYGDIDNDGDEDLLVLSVSGPNRLLENRDGHFVSLDIGPGLEGKGLHPSSCSMGDVNGDGLLDIAVANTFQDWNNRLPLMLLDQESAMETNQLFLNKGGLRFAEVSDSSGIASSRRITWAIAMIDYDMDGDTDIVMADDQGPRAPAKYGGADFGYLRIYQNDGTGHFTDITVKLGMDQFGAWMGLAFGDINADGNMDMFASNIGDYASIFTGPMLGFGQVIGEWASVWWLGDGKGGFTKGSIDALGATPFGWGNAMADYDNDGDTDIIMYGGLDVGIYQDGSNAGTILENDGSGRFSLDAAALASSVNHARKNERGLAVGDLDDDGFVDIVSVSNQNWPEAFPTPPYPVVPLGSVFDQGSIIWPTFSPIDSADPSKGFRWNGFEPTDGTLSIEMNSGNGNGWVKIRALGAAGLIPGGRVNRDGIGAIVRFRPEGGAAAMRPIMGGSSYASQHSLEGVFGLGGAEYGVVDVFWPGGVKNRLYGVSAHETVVFPEIPCSYDDSSMSRREYHRCVRTAIRGLVSAGVLDKHQAARFLTSARRAWVGRRHPVPEHDYESHERDGKDDEGRESEGDRGHQGRERLPKAGGRDGAQETGHHREHEREHGGSYTSGSGPDSPVRLHDIASRPDSGIDFQRGPSTNKAILDAFKSTGFVDFSDLAVRSQLPVKPRGSPGVALFDYDGDGDMDMYVTNGPGMPNALLENRLRQDGRLHFVDVALQAGVALTEDDSTGVCVGDTDNDGDPDLVVMNLAGHNRFLENLGDGRFADASLDAGFTADGRHPSSCTLGDVDNDGLLDLAVGNTFDNWDHRLPLMTFDNDALMEANQLFLNRGGNHFEDVSTGSGIDTPSRITWALALVDYDQDGDVDLVTADDQGAKAPAKYGGVDHGFVRIFRNDGSGHFTNVTAEVGTNRFGAWMGLSFGDFNRDGLLDIFATNTGYFITNFMRPILGFPIVLGEWASGWFLAQPDGRFVFPGVGDMVGTPFGWGTSTADYDNDADTDIIYHGGMDMGAFVDASNPGALLRNDGQAHFSRDAMALDGSVNHRRRTVQGMAVGDLNDDGFTDIVSVASETWPDFLPLAPYLPPSLLEGSPFDSTASIWPTFAPVDPTDFSKGMVATGMEPANGDLAVEINGGNGNHWVKIRARGSIGLVSGAKVNRDGIGAVIHFRPEGMLPVLHPVVAGSSYASQDSLTAVFGLEGRASGQVDIEWPGGVHNRLYGVRSGERVRFQEIPCDYRSKKMGRRAYRRCVGRSLAELVSHHTLTARESRRFYRSAMKAWSDVH